MYALLLTCKRQPHARADVQRSGVADDWRDERVTAAGDFGLEVLLPAVRRQQPRVRAGRDPQQDVEE
jgi:hypothetical protein